MKAFRLGRHLLAAALIAVAASGCAEGWWGPLPGDRRAIAERWGEWQRALREERTADAYAYMTPAYREEHSLTAFGEEFSGWGELYALDPDCYMRGTRNRAYVHPFALDFFELANGPLAEWEKIDGSWMFTGEVEWLRD